MTEEILTENIKKLVLARLMIMPSNLRLSIGSKDYTKEELQNHIEKGDEVGKEFAEMQIEFLRDLASGSIYQYE